MIPLPAQSASPPEGEARNASRCRVGGILGAALGLPRMSRQPPHPSMLAHRRPPPQGGRRLVIIALFVLLAAAPAHAVEPDEMLKDPAQEARAEQIGRQLRCPVCKTESIEESDADFTRDLRKVVRERIAAGDSDRQVMDYMHDRYGDFILLKPPFQPSTWALWLAPPVLLLLGVLFALRAGRRRAANEAGMLTPAEKAAIEALK